MMSGNNWAKNPGRRLVIAALIAASAGFGLGGCNDTNSANTGPGYNTVTSPKGTVQGTVVDNNGNPLQGVKVTTGTQTATTDASGTYNFSNVVVSNTATQQNDPSATGQFITLTLQPPTGYLGATIVLAPQSQVVAGGTQGNGGGVTNPQVVFVDGYSASAGTAVLPAVNAVVSGTLRDANSQAPLAGVALYANLTSVQPSGATGGNGVNVTYATGSNTAVSGGQTAADGTFSFPPLAANSCYSIYAVGYNVTLAGSDVGNCPANGGPGNGQPNSSLAQVRISTANAPVQLNQIFAAKSPNADTVAPWVNSVDHVLNEAAGVGQLDSTVTNVLVLHFDEQVTYTPAANNPITVISGPAFNQAQQPITSIALDGTGTVMTITLTNTLPVNSPVLVNIPIQLVADLAGNLLSAPAAQNVGFDNVANNVDTLTLQTFNPSGTVPAFTMKQNFGPDAVSATDPVLAPLYADSNALVNVAGDSAGFNAATSSAGAAVSVAATFAAGNIYQLNSAQPQPLVANQLFNLAQAFAGFAGNVNTQTARVTISLAAVPPAGSDLAMQVTDSLGNPKDVLIYPQQPAIAENAFAGPGTPVLPKSAAANNSTPITNPAISTTANLWFGIDPKGAQTFDVLIVGNGVALAPGDKLSVIARSLSGATHLIGTGAILTLKDEVDPTAALQILGVTQGAAGSSSLGQGGVIFTGGTAAGIPTVVFPVTPQIGDTSDNGDAQPGIYAGNSFVQELFAPSGLSAAGAVNAAPADSQANLRTDTDATGVNAYLTGNASAAGSLNVKAAIAVDESVTSAATLSVPYTGAAVLSGFGAIPDVVSKKSGPVALPVAGVFNDLVTLNVNNIFTLAADGRANKVIDLTGTITDQNGNVAATGDNARVVVQDLFPPLMTAAYTDGKHYTFKFNEPIQLYGALVLDQCAQTLDLHALATLATPKASLDVTGTVLTVSQSAVTGNCFFPVADTTHTYAESIYTTANTGVTTIPAKLQHGFVNFNNVPDSVGNTWDVGGGTPAPNEAGVTPWSQRVLGMGAPRFAMVNLVGPLGVSATISGFTAGATSFTASLTANQPLDNLLSATTGAAGTNPGTPVEPAIYTTGVTVTLGIGAFPCAAPATYATAACKTFIDHNLKITGACAVPSNTSTAALNADGTGISFSISCPAAIASTNTATLASDNNTFESTVVDPNTGNNGVFTLGTAANLYMVTVP